MSPVEPAAAGPVWIVVPCFNEAGRLDADVLGDLARQAAATVLIVDDGSTDGTAELAAALRDGDPSTFDVLATGANLGKGEAVRRGLCEAIGRGAGIVGYYDADGATPPAEMARLVAVARDDAAAMAVLGSRVALLGTRIDRSATRHYLGRVFATASSLLLGMTVYDTQCGAKVFRTGPALRAALASPFHSRWAFDVELLGRLLHGADGVDGLPEQAFREVPLAEWRDPGGSKLGPLGAARAGMDLLRVGAALRRTR
jgi:glycosyltransferase involved in cell wall biosynthesis